MSIPPENSFHKSITLYTFYFSLQLYVLSSHSHVKCAFWNIILLFSLSFCACLLVFYIFFPPPFLLSFLISKTDFFFSVHFVFRLYPGLNIYFLNFFIFFLNFYLLFFSQKKNEKKKFKKIYKKYVSI